MIIHNFPGKITTLYAVQYPSGSVMLLDSGYACDKDAAVQHLKALGISETSVKFVVASHAHPDHAGGASFWQRSGARVAAPQGTNLWYTGIFGWMQHRVDMGLVFYVEDVATRSVWRKIRLVMRELVSPSATVYFPRHIDYDVTIPVPSPVAPDEELSVLVPLVGSGSEDEATFPELNEWFCVPVPGHTDHMVALWHPLSRTLYAADTLLHGAHRPKDLQAPVTIDFADLYIQSVERLARLPVCNLLLAHGGSFRMKSLAASLDGKDGAEVAAAGETYIGTRMFPGGDWATKINALAARLRKDYHERQLSKSTGLRGWRAAMVGLLNLPTLLNPRLFRIRRALKHLR